MYKFIPLNTPSLSMIKSINDKPNNIFVCGTNTYTALCEYESYPLKNRPLAINNVLEFLQYIDTLKAKNNIVKISSRIIRKIFTGEKYTAYLNILSELRIINRVPYDDGEYYEQKKRYCQYYVHHNYRTDKLGLVIADTTSAVKLTTDRRYPAKFHKAIRYTECDFAGAINSEYDNYIKTGMDENKLRIRLSRLLALNGNRFIKKGRNVDRIYHSFSNLSKISREHLHIHNQKYHSLDIKNCQPLLLCFLLRESGMALDSNYLTDCENAEIYYRFVTGKKYKTNDDVKKPLYSAIYFDFKPQKKIAQKFKKLYPLTYNSLELLHSCGTTVASKLQNLEASVFNNILPKKSKFYFTLFDAIYFTSIADVCDLTKQIKEKFSCYGITPKIA